MSAPTDQAAILYLRITCSVNGIFYASMYALDSFALASGALPHRRLHHEDGASLAPGGLLGLRIHRNLCGAGSGAGSARPHRLRIPPAMGEKELARASVSQRAVPLTHAKQRSFALETISASQKTNDPAGRQGREVHGAGDGTRTREYKLGKLGPYHLATPACVKRIIAHLFPFEKKHIFRHG